MQSKGMSLNLLKMLSPGLRKKIAKKVGAIPIYREHFDETRSIFIHIPKAAGLSVVDALYGVDSSAHFKWIDFYSKDKKKYEEYYSFSFVRNPADRLFSAYTYLMKGGREEIDEFWRNRYVVKYKNFSDFVENGLEIAIRSGVEHFLPQSDYLFDDDDCLMVDFLGRYETLDKDFKIVAEKLGISKPLARLNSSDSKSYYLENCESKCDEVLGRVYGRDYRLLSYDFPERGG